MPPLHADLMSNYKKPFGGFMKKYVVLLALSLVPALASAQLVTYGRARFEQVDDVPNAASLLITGTAAKKMYQALKVMTKNCSDGAKLRSGENYNCYRSIVQRRVEYSCDFELDKETGTSQVDPLACN